LGDLPDGEVSTITYSNSATTIISGGSSPSISTIVDYDFLAGSSSSELSAYVELQKIEVQKLELLARIEHDKARQQNESTKQANALALAKAESTTKLFFLCGMFALQVAAIIGLAWIVNAIWNPSWNVNQIGTAIGIILLVLLIIIAITALSAHFVFHKPD